MLVSKEESILLTGISVPLEMFPSIFGAILALGLLIKPYRFRNIILCFLLIELSFLHFLRTYCMYKGKILHSSLVAFPVFMSIGVLVYFYILTIDKNKNTINKKDFFHFIPTLASIIAVIIYYSFSDACSWMFYGETSPTLAHHVLFIASWCYTGIYVAVSIKHICISIKKSENVHKVFRYLLVLLFLIYPAIITAGAGLMMHLPQISAIGRLYTIIITFFLGALFFLLLRYPFFLQYGIIPPRRKDNSKSKSCLEGIDVRQLENNIRNVMVDEKLYFDEDLSLKRFSETLGISSRQLSQFINEHYSKNFNSFINEYRIRESKTMLLEQPDRNILHIANAVGFNSYSVFYTAFKDHTGLSPVEYRKKNL